MKQFSFGKTQGGEPVTAYCIENTNGAQAVILNYGATLQSLKVPNRAGGFTDVVLGYDTIAEYEAGDGYLGATIGRFGNRIAKGSFELNGKRYALAVNNGPNHLHGGAKGFDKYVWGAKVQANTLVLSRLSPDGEEGYPGNLQVSVEYTLENDNSLRIVYRAVCDADTVVNLTNHSYFNLNGGGTVLGHTLTLMADQFSENDENTLPTGRMLSVEGTPFDFRTEKPIGQQIHAPDTQLTRCSGYDHNFVIRGEGPRFFALLASEQSGICMETLTCRPAVQLYTANFLTPRTGKGGIAMQQQDAVCLETQGFPNAPCIPGFPSAVLAAGEEYHSETVYRFKTI